MLNGLGGESDLGDEDKDRFSAVQTVLGGLALIALVRGDGTSSTRA